MTPFFLVNGVIRVFRQVCQHPAKADPVYIDFERLISEGRYHLVSVRRGEICAITSRTSSLAQTREKRFSSRNSEFKLFICFDIDFDAVRRFSCSFVRISYYMAPTSARIGVKGVLRSCVRCAGSASEAFRSFLS